ncbi:MAG: hypothetical protein R3C49_06575 [Planctomycetaceae bacterium]
MAKKKAVRSNPAQELGEKILAELENRRSRGSGYPATLREIAREAASGVTDEDIKAALTVKPLKPGLVSAFSDDLDALVVRKEDASLLAGHHLILQHLLQQVCSPQTPHASVDTLADMLQKPLSAAFRRQWNERLKQNRMPDFAAAVVPLSSLGQGKARLEFHDVRFPLPWVQLSEQLTTQLRQHAADSANLPVPESQVTAANRDRSTEELAAAKSSEPYSSEVAVVRIVNDERQITTRVQLQSVVCGLELFTSLIQESCSEAAPVIRLSELAKRLDKTVQSDFRTHWLTSISTDGVPECALIEKLAKNDVVLRDARFPRPEVVLSQTLTAAVEALCQADSDSGCVSLSDLLNHCQVSADNLLLPAARKTEPFVSTATIVRQLDAAEWMTLSSMADDVVRRDGFLKRLLPETCTAAAPEVRLSALAKQLPKSVQSAFVETWKDHADQRHSFDWVELSLSGKSDVVLRDSRFPKRELLLSKLLVDTLQTLKDRNDGSYPCTFATLMEAVGPDAGFLLANAAVREEPYRSRVITAVPQSAHSPIGFKEDTTTLATTPLLLPALLPLITKPDDQAVVVTKLNQCRELHPVLRPEIVSAVEQNLQSRQLPSGIGCLKVAKKWHIFRKQDVLSSSGQ